METDREVHDMGTQSSATVVVVNVDVAAARSFAGV